MTFTTSTVDRTPCRLQAEPNWAFWGDTEGGLPNPQYDGWVSVYCDLQTRSTVCVTRQTQPWLTEEGECGVSWVGYEWDSEGRVWALSYGDPEDASCRWWEVDDLLWGCFGESYLWAVVDGVVRSREELVEWFKGSSLLDWRPACRDALELWWGELTPAEEVRFGLTEAEVQEGCEFLEESLGDFFD